MKIKTAKISCKAKYSSFAKQCTRKIFPPYGIHCTYMYLYIPAKHWNWYMIEGNLALHVRGVNTVSLSGVLGQALAWGKMCPFWTVIWSTLKVEITLQLIVSVPFSFPPWLTLPDGCRRERYPSLLATDGELAKCNLSQHSVLFCVPEMIYYKALTRQQTKAVVVSSNCKCLLQSQYEYLFMDKWRVGVGGGRGGGSWSEQSEQSYMYIANCYWLIVQGQSAPL